MILPANVLRIKLGFKQPGYLFAENLQSALIGKQVSEHLRRCYGRSMYILLGRYLESEVGLGLRRSLKFRY